MFVLNVQGTNRSLLCTLGMGQGNSVTQLLRPRTPNVQNFGFQHNFRHRVPGQNSTRFHGQGGLPPCAEMQIKDWDFHDEFSDQYILIENLLKKHHLTPVRLLWVDNSANIFKQFQFLEVIYLGPIYRGPPLILKECERNPCNYKQLQACLF
jgi:hypothetical protein